MNALETLRPTNGDTGAIFNQGPYGENFIKVLAEYLDQGDGWVDTTRNSLTWYTGTLALEATTLNSGRAEGDFAEYVNIDISLVNDVKEYTEECLVLLNNMNAQAAGWVAWADSDNSSIKFSLRVGLKASQWWWQSLAFQIAPVMLSAAVARAHQFARATNGKIAVRNHPTRGERPTRDSWIDGAHQLLREPTASLDLIFTSRDYSIIDAAMRHQFPQSRIEIEVGPQVRLMDQNGAIYSQLKNYWHQTFGLGWQLISIENEFDYRRITSNSVPNDDDLLGVAERNRSLMTSETWHSIMGGWVVQMFGGYQRQMFLSAQWIETLISDGRHTVGTITALIFAMFEGLYNRPSTPIEIDPEDETVDSHNKGFQFATSQIVGQCSEPGCALLLPEELQPFTGTWPSQLNLDLIDDILWHVPRSARICSFGIFNPAGPTISSLELGRYEDQWTLYFVLRHPFGSTIQEISSFSDSDFEAELPKSIIEALSDSEQGVLGTGPDWMHITWYDPEPIFVGLQQFAFNKSDADWTRECKRILGSGFAPWARLSLEEDELPEINVERADLEWIGLIMEPDVIAGYQYFIRSAWEGAKRFALGDTDGAQAATNSVNQLTIERINLDFDFRNQEGFLIEYPKYG